MVTQMSISKIPETHLPGNAGRISATPGSRDSAGAAPTQHIRRHIEDHQERIARHRFFSSLSRLKDLQALTLALPDLCFWVMTFQDILAVNESRITGEPFRQVARTHREEDAGHDRWFLSDLQVLGHDEPSVHTLFGRQFSAVRFASFALMSEAYRASNDVERIILLLTLESAGHVFFERVAASLAGHERIDELKYFSSYHLGVEQDHDMFGDDAPDPLCGARLDEDALDSCRSLVDRCYRAFDLMFDALADSLESNAGDAPCAQPLVSAIRTERASRIESLDCA